MLPWNYWEEEQYEFKLTQLLKLPELGVFESFEMNKSAIAPLVMLTCLSFGRASPIWKYHPTTTGFYLDLLGRDDLYASLRHVYSNCQAPGLMKSKLYP